MTKRTSNYQYRRGRGCFTVTLFGLVLTLASCKGHPEHIIPKLGETVHVKHKAEWRRILQDIIPRLRTVDGRITYYVSFDTNFVVDYIETSDPGFRTVDGIGPGVSYQHASAVTTVAVEKLPLGWCDVYREITNETVERVRFLGRLPSEWSILFKMDYPPSATMPSPDDVGELFFIDASAVPRTNRLPLTRVVIYYDKDPFE